MSTVHARWSGHLRECSTVAEVEQKKELESFKKKEKRGERGGKGIHKACK